LEKILIETADDYNFNNKLPTLLSSESTPSLFTSEKKVLLTAFEHCAESQSKIQL
jgi:hypothetical protein